MSVSLPPDESSQTDVPSTHAASWWETLFTTPLSDVIRGDWSSRYKQLLRSSALPPPIAERISRIIRKAHLWRSERNDTTRELIAHFQEGLDRGVSAALLVEQFGDVKTTARLIRRAKLRKRPIWWKTWYGVSRSIVVVLAILMVVYVVQAVRFFTGKPVITLNIVKELNDPLRKIPVEDRAWPLYVEAMKGFPDWPKGILEFEKISPHMEQWPEVVKFAHANKDRVAAIRRAAKKPHLGWLIGDPNDPAFQMSDADDERFAGVKTDRRFLEESNPSSLEFKIPFYLLMEMSRLLWLSARVAVEEKKGDEVYDNMVASFDLADQVLQADGTAIIIVQMFGISIFKSANTLLLELLARHPDLLSVEQLEGIKRRLEAFHSGQVIRFSFEAERLLFVDLLQRTYTPGDHGVLTYAGGKQVRGWYLRPGNETFGDSAFYWIDLLGPIAMTVAVDKGQAQSEFDDLLDHEIARFSSRPWEWTYDESDDHRQLDRTLIGFYRNPIGALLYPASNSLAEHAERAELGRNTALFALGLTIFKRQEGRWPDRSEELVPRYLSKLPPDPHDGQPLRYKLTESGPIVYSIGEDRHDDGGRATLIQIEGRDRFTIGYMNPEKRDAILNNPNDPRNGDWILWPPVEKKSEP